MNFPEKQGYYVRTGGEWLPSVGVPNEHIAGKFAILLNDMCYVSGTGRVLSITMGFPFNGISSPWVLWPITGHPWGKYLRAALFHDHMCAIAHTKHQRYDADAMFIEFLWALGATWVTQRAWFRAVRIGSLIQKYDQPDYRIKLADYYEYLGLPRDLADFYTKLREEKA